MKMLMDNRKSLSRVPKRVRASVSDVLHNKQASI